MSQCPQITEEGLNYLLPNIRHLADLDIDGCNISEEGLQNFIKAAEKEKENGNVLTIHFGDDSIFVSYKKY